MRISFGPVVFLIVMILAITAAFGTLLTPTEVTNPSTQRAQATVMLKQAEMNLALTATPQAYQGFVAEAASAPMRATTTAIAISSSIQANVATATAQAIDTRRKLDELTIQQHAAALADQQRLNIGMIWGMIVLMVAASVSCLAVAFHVIRARSIAAQMAMLQAKTKAAIAEADLDKQRRWRLMCESNQRAHPPQRDDVTSPGLLPNPIRAPLMKPVFPEQEGARQHSETANNGKTH